jgi:hypothetical protein
MANVTEPSVTVIVPNYNYERTLGLCLAATQQQTYRSLDIVVVDDCSTDGSVAVARSMGVPVVSTGRNSGVAVARNLGASVARGDILMFVDSDVAMHPDAVEQAVRLLAADPTIGAVTGNYDPAPLIDDGVVERYRNFHQYFWLHAGEGFITDFVPTAILAVPARVFEEVGPCNPVLRETEGQRHRILLTGAVRGQHDNDATLATVLRKVFTRTRLHVPFFLRRDRIGEVATTAQSGGCLSAALAAVGLAAPVFLGPVGVAVPMLPLLAWLFSDRTMYAAAWRYRGAGFAVQVAALHYLVSVTTAAALSIGLLQWMTSVRFRHLYDPAPATAQLGVPR